MDASGPTWQEPPAWRPLLADLVSGVVVVREARTDAGVPQPPADERAVVAHAVASRRREFATTRHCARQALAALGRPVEAIPRDAAGAPVWPSGTVGSLTHCDGYRAAAVAESRHLRTIGIDAEVDAPLPDGVFEAVAGPAEREHLAVLPSGAVCWQRLLFSAKEAVYKAWYPLARSWLDFGDAEVTINPHGLFEAHIVVAGPLRRLAGRWAVRDGILVTVVEVPAGQ